MANADPAVECSEIWDRHAAQMCANCADDKHFGVTGFGQNYLKYIKYLFVCVEQRGLRGIVLLFYLLCSEAADEHRDS